MTEKSFAATPYLCQDEIPDSHFIMTAAFENFIMTTGWTASKLKDFESIHILAVYH